MEKYVLEENQVSEIKEFISTQKNVPGNLMPTLQKITDVFGYLPRPILEIVSSELRIPMAEIYGVSTFYSQFSFVPKGKHGISVCMGTACYVKGAENILDEFSSVLEIGVGETTEDLMFSILEARCLGDCAAAPVVMIDDVLYKNVEKKHVKKIIKDIRDEENEQQ